MSNTQQPQTVLEAAMEKWKAERAARKPQCQWPFARDLNERAKLQAEYEGFLIEQLLRDFTAHVHDILKEVHAPIDAQVEIMNKLYDWLHKYRR
jgi:hypothetical protein